MKGYVELFVKYLKPMRPKAALLAALIFIGIGLQLVNPQLIRYFIDAVMGEGEIRSLLLLALTFLGVSLLTQLVGIVATYVGEDVGWRVTNQLRADLTSHCLRLDMSFHNAHTPGEMIERIDGDILILANFFSRFVIRVLGNLLLLVGVLVVLAFEDGRITLAMLTYIILGLVGMGILRRIAVPYWMAARQADADLTGFLEEQLAGTEDIRSSGAVAYVMRNLFKFNRDRLDKRLKSSSMDALIAMTWGSLYVLGQVVAFSLSYILLQQGAITIGVVYLVIYFTHFIFIRLLEVATEVQYLQRAAASIERIESLFTIESKIQSLPEPASLSAGPLAVVFNSVTFGYSETKPVLQDVSFQLPPGQVLGLLGRTGSGKTTLTRLLFRLYDPNRGSICLGLNGHQSDIRELALTDLRQRIGLVTQNVQLFQATARDNLTFFDNSIPDERILQVIEALQLAEWYDSLPAGLDTELQTEGSNLSAGEAQLLALTRVFLHDPGLVILDEASSRLDPATEKLIERAIARLLADRTGIIVAHRLSTVRQVDSILIIEGGQIQEFGQYADLAHNSSSRFYQLLQTGLEEVLA